MATTPDPDALAKREPDAPARDPITSRSTSSILLICALLLTGVLGWALYDEVYGQRGWKSIQRSFVERYSSYLRRQRGRARRTEKEVKESEEYQKLAAEANEERQAVEPRKKEIDRAVEHIENQLAAITDEFQNTRGRITVINYNIEQSEDESDKNELRKEVEEERQRQVTINMPAADGKKQKQKLNYIQIEKLYNDLKDQKAKLLTERAELLKEPDELAKKRDEYLKDNLTGLTEDQVRGLIRKMDDFDFSIRQINVNEFDIVDRCETCHLGVREPLRLTPAAMTPRRKKQDALARAFVSHPSKDLLDIHNPDRFGCSSCHGGNGRATTSVEKGHGRHRFWLHPLYERENMQAGCQQCHTNDRVLDGAPVLNLGKDLFQNRGCVGCHRYEGFDRETDALSNARQTIKQLEDEMAANEREARQSVDASGTAADDTEAQRLLARAESLRVSNSLIAARVEQLKVQSSHLMQDQKKVGPNLKDVRLKLRKGWIPEWLQNPQAFRPGTKMPTYWRIDGEGRTAADKQREENERKAIAAYIWQESFAGQVPQQAQGGNAAHGKELFETRGCMACHSIGEGDPSNYVGGDFAANLQRVGEKANFDYIVRWIYNPRERWAPYCPKEKRDLTREDYEKNNRPFVFDIEHATCPNDGAVLQVQNMTVMPNFRLTEADARDIATYLFSLSGRSPYPEDSANLKFMDDPALKETGRALIKTYGCAGCHEIKGFEDEQRIGKELSAEGSTPIERLDFAMLTHDAERGIDPYDEHKKVKPWYNHKGFISHKIDDPSIYDRGKEKEPQDMLRMPDPYMPPEWNNALTTFLMGSVGLEGASVPQRLFYNPNERQKAIQDGWWVIKKYNCMGCHNIQVGQKSVLSGLPLYQSAEWRDQLPPQLTSEGARVDPDWLLRFLRDPSLSEEGGKPEPGRSDKTVGVRPGPQENPYTPGNQTGQKNGNGSQQAGNKTGQQAGQPGSKLPPQPGADRNGVRPYLKARMPTFSFSPNELRTLVRFFMAVSAQQEPYIKQPQEPLSEQERMLARQLFTSRGAPCLKCHITGDPEHDKTALAPNFLLASERLKPNWTFRWLLDPQQISPGTAMPSGLFKKDGERWVFSGETPPSFAEYHRDHADLLVRYMFQLTPEEQRRLATTSPSSTAGQSPAPTEKETAPPAATGQSISRNSRRRSNRRTIASVKSMKRSSSGNRTLVSRKVDESPPVRKDRLVVSHHWQGSFVP